MLSVLKPIRQPMDNIGDSTLGLHNGNTTPTLTRGVNGPSGRVGRSGLKSQGQ